jgi:hypothetical protein
MTSEPVFRLIYRSRSLIDAEQRRTALGEIFATARRNNREADVTGALMISEDAFVQALEGDEATVRELYATIREDPRHTDVTLLEEHDVDARTFGRWAMAQVGEDGGADIRLMSNPSKGVIVAARAEDPSITPEQETVLAGMRRSLAGDTLER